LSERKERHEPEKKKKRYFAVARSRERSEKKKGRWPPLKREKTTPVGALGRKVFGDGEKISRKKPKSRLAAPACKRKRRPRRGNSLDDWEGGKKVFHLAEQIGEGRIGRR